MSSKRIKNKQILVSSNFDFNSNRIINLSEPSGVTDGATKNYVDTSILEFAAIPHEPTGFQVSQKEASTIYVSGNTFYIMPIAESFDYYIAGQKFTSTGDTITITNVEGNHFFYFNDDVLTQTTTFNSDIIFTYAYVAELYWNVSEQRVIHLGEERHGLVMDGTTHAYLHNKFGTTYISGLGLGDFTITGAAASLDEHAQFSVSQGQIWDEDIIHIIEDSATQQISFPLNCPVFYRSGTTWNSYTGGTYATGNTFAIINYDFNNANLLAYNLNTLGDWSLVEVGNNQFVLSHIFATNDVNTPIIAILGQETYATAGDARSGANVEMGNLITNGLSFQEFVPMATVIYQTASAYTNTPKAKIVQTDLGDNYVNWLGQSLSPTSAPSDHGSLGGLNDDDHFQYALLAGRGNETLTIDKVSGLANPTNDTDAVNYGFFKDNTVSSVSGGTFLSGVTILGDFHVSGTTTFVNTQQLNVADNIITINSGETGAGVTYTQAGIQVDRGSLDPYIFIFNEVNDTFRIGQATIDTPNTFDLTDTQAVATREDLPILGGIPYWNYDISRYDTIGGFKYDINNDFIYLGNSVSPLTGISMYTLNTTMVGNIWLDNSGVTLKATSTSATNFAMTNTTMIISSDYGSFEGIKYDIDYSANYTSRSLVDYNWLTTTFLLDGKGTTANNRTIDLGGSITSGETFIITCNTENNFTTTFTLGDSGNDQAKMNYVISGVHSDDPELSVLAYTTETGEETKYQVISQERQDSPVLYRNIIELAAGSGTTSMSFIVGSGNFKIYDNRTSDTRGIEYDSDYSPYFSNRSLIDKDYVDGLNTFIFQTQSGITGNTILEFQCPLKYRITSIIAEETIGFIAGNVSIGISAWSNEIVNSETIDADDVIDLPIGQKFFSLVANTDIYVSSTAFGSGQLSLYFKFEKVVE